jgi:hypothetical protein
MGRRAKSWSATRHFREQGAPNRPVQDLPTIPLLCLGCEKTFKAWEDDFRVKVFEPWAVQLETADPAVLPEDVPLPEGSWLSPYVRSLCWRALHYTNERGVRNMNLTPMAQAAHLEWRQELRDGTPSKSPFWVVQARLIDNILKHLGYVGNRGYIFGAAHIQNMETGLVGSSQWTAVFEDGTVKQQPVQVDVLCQTAIVKNYGFAFLGAHVPNPPSIPTEVFAGNVTLSAFKGSIGPHRRMWEEVSLTQQANDATAHDESRASGSPSLFTKFKDADTAERAADASRKVTDQ